MKTPDFAFQSFILLLKLLQVPVDAKLLRQDYGKSEHWNSSDLLHVARHLLDLNAKRRNVSKKQLSQLPTPFLLEAKDGHYLLVAKWLENGQALVQNVSSQAPQTVFLDVLWEQKSGEVLLFKPKGKADTPLEKKFGFGWFWKALLEQKMVFSQVILAAVFIQVFALVTPLFSMVVMDKVFSASSFNTLDVLFIGVAIFTLFEFVLSLLRKHILSHATTKLDVILSARVFQKLTQLPIGFFSKRQTGDTVIRIKELESIRSFISGHGLSALIDFPFSLIILGVMFLFSPEITLIAVIGVVLFFVVYGLVSPFLKDRLHQKHKMTVDNQSYLVETVRGMDTLKSMALEAQMQRRWEKQVVDHSEFAAMSEGLSGNVSQVGQFISKSTIALTMYFGALGVMNGSLTPGQMIAMNMLVGRVMGPAQRVAQMLMQMHQVSLSVKRLGEILDAQEEPNLRKHRQHMPEIKGAVKFEKVSFKYSEDSPLVLDNLGFEIKAGEVIGVVGASGAGKSTLVRLLLKLYQPTSGKIYLDDVPLAQYDPVWLRRNIGVVLQDNLLFNLSVRDNIAITDSTLPNEKIEIAAQLAGVDEFVHHLENGYDTLVGEQGSLLSAGQKQRIAIARALISDPSILILDEATSDLDSKSEQIIQNHMQQMTAGRTTFVIAHRLSTLKMADKILVLEKGQIVEAGTPRDLLARQGHFYDYYQLQKVA